MAARPPMRSMNAHSTVKKRTTVRVDAAEAEASASSQVAHTLTACTRCRQRKTRCDPGLPRCTPCERTNSLCEYFDSTRGHTVNRNYVVYLQHKVRELEDEVAKVDNDDINDDPEAMMRAANIHVHDAQDSKYLGPSSGIAITRLVMQLAKQFTDAKSISEIVPDQRARQIRELYNEEQAKPTSKIYPLISHVAAPDMPNRDITDLLLALYKLKVQPMYPALHEKLLDRDVESVYCNPSQASPYQHFICRMVIAISLQKMDTQYAGLADSYYLAALQYLDAVVRPMDLHTLQCFAMMAQYSLLTPTRTAIYYVMGIAVRLTQALGLNEEKTITRGRAGTPADAQETDIRRRVFWCVLVMELGLAHSLGRPSILATSRDHLDVKWFEMCDDQYITPEGIDPTAPRSIKKWVAIHFFKMRLLQLEIRRKLYQRKRHEPKDDSDPWFVQMASKLVEWRDASPSPDEGIGLDKIWFIGRYNTMIVFLYRPSPQVPRPSVRAAVKCFDACQYNIYMQREQITKRNVDLTWIFTQSIFMAINTLLWSLSYVEVRRLHRRENVERHLEVAMDAIQLASDRWPGVASAVQLYNNLITAILKIYEKDGDVPIAAGTPSDELSPNGTSSDAYVRSRTTSPVTSHSVSSPPEQKTMIGGIHQRSRGSIEQPPPVPYQSDPVTSNESINSSPAYQPSLLATPGSQHSNSSRQYFPLSNFSPGAQYTSLPEFNQSLTVPGWTAAQTPHLMYASTTASEGSPAAHTFDSLRTPSYESILQPAYNILDGDYDSGLNNSQNQYAPQYWDMDSGSFGTGLTQSQQEELMRSLETDGMEDIQTMITNSLAAFK